MRSRATNVLVIGMDAADPALLRAWAAEGVLPNIRALMDHGLVGDTKSLEGFFVGSTWPSLYTGVSPARHGFHYQVQIEPGTYRYHEPAAGAFVKSPPVWTTLSRAGRRVAILDVPLSRIDPEVNGIQIVEWGGHDALFPFQTVPPALADRIVEVVGGHPLRHACDAIRRSAEDYRDFIEHLVRGARSRAALTTHFLRDDPWDLVFQVFTESHCAGHQGWHLHATDHPGHDPAVRAVTGDPLRLVYSAIDAGIGEVVEAVGDATVILIAAHGMSHWFGANFLLQEILFRLRVSAPAAESEPPGAIGSLARAGWQRLRNRPPASLRARRSSLPSLGVDPERSRCFMVKNGLATGGIRLNLVGREPRGLLERGRDADQFVDELTAALQEIIDDRTGRPVIKRVMRTSDLYSGACFDELPDLLVDWDDAIPTGSTQVAGGAAALVRVRSPRIGVVEGVNKFGRTGEHRIGGLFVARGAGIQPGLLGRTVSIMDLAPTIAAILGVDMPGTDGVVIPELLGSGGDRGRE
jgi:predicted AlkP superfamily phosphohydrolase/phosphomutase